MMIKGELWRLGLSRCGRGDFDGEQVLLAVVGRVRSGSV